MPRMTYIARLRSALAAAAEVTGLQGVEMIYWGQGEKNNGVTSQVLLVRRNPHPLYALHLSTSFFGRASKTSAARPSRLKLVWKVVGSLRLWISSRCWQFLAPRLKKRRHDWKSPVKSEAKPRPILEGSVGQIEIGTESSLDDAPPLGRGSPAHFILHSSHKARHFSSLVDAELDSIMNTSSNY